MDHPKDHVWTTGGPPGESGVNLRTHELCEYTATLIGNADRDGTVVPEKAPAAANRILEHC
ncbi:hypothetical protein [Arthrobacter sp. ISL-65]|uniref:hypothetical protein n=1 Tax=Arthrobacter sp. ISL-65 TaxID=2819112 RepID=UPI001BEB5EFA|nr:hypothetical protein [Arthrobacter sp. ISL-65]MBT2550489.1 hypothetical protein [Arthrobacter sp. ISL-65]